VATSAAGSAVAADFCGALRFRSLRAMPIYGCQ
jgi:hypothetical protein